MRLVKQHSSRSGLAAQYSAVVSVFQNSQSSPLAVLGRREIEALKYRHIARQSTFRPQHSSVLFSEDKADTRLRKGINSLKIVSQAVLGGR